ncbi:hypothetical protein O3P69_019186 [Scylla paramamosain]|uniref:SF4 helicase domain-containing protein n=1 Tax=Scylla paramamosain TaxID=85552 RepID=A0AAW0SVR9_SCYPA
MGSGGAGGGGSGRCLHIGNVFKQRDIPEYLLGYISQVTAESDLLGDELEEEEEEKDMEDDIVDFLNTRILTFEETDTSFVLPCPTCPRKNEEETKLNEIFVDKNSGYFVCPWCCRDGTWEELMALLDTREDSLTANQLIAYLDSALPVAEVADDWLNESPLKNISRVTLEKFAARVTADRSRLLLPVTDHLGDTVGVESVSLLHHLPQIIRRFVTGQSRVFSPPTTTTTTSRRERVVVVPTCCDVLTLAECGVYAVSLPSEDVSTLERHIATYDLTEVLVWCRGLPPPRPLLLALIQTGVACSLVQSAENDTPVYLKSGTEIKIALNKTIPVLSSATTTFSQIKDKVYYRLTHKEETCGVQWRRFAGLNDILLGHRPGELTVLTGPTGCGKTTLMAEYSLDLCCQGVPTLWGSFEVSVVRLCEVMLQQYSGSPLPQDLHQFNTLASQFSTLPLHFLTYHGQHDVKAVVKAMREAVQVWGVQHIIIDNLQFMLGTGKSGSSAERWWEQDLAVSSLRRFATQTGCHVTVIAHPKKVPEGQLLGIDSVFGSAKVTQEADNVMILQVKAATSSLTSSRKVLQVVKNRYGGQLGDLPLRFHKDSLTLSSCFRQKVRERSQKGEREGSGGSLKKINIKGLSRLGL